jgi:hypothetical protein
LLAGPVAGEVDLIEIEESRAGAGGSEGAEGGRGEDGARIEDEGSKTRRIDLDPKNSDSGQSGTGNGDRGEVAAATRS